MSNITQKTRQIDSRFKILDLIEIQTKYTTQVRLSVLLVESKDK